MIKVVFIDIDNTLLDFSAYVKEAMESGFRKFGLRPYTPDMFDRFEQVNGALWRQIERGELTLEQLEKIRWDRIFDSLGIDFDGVVFEKFFRANLFSSAIPEPGAREMLCYLQPRYVLSVASNGPYEQQLNRLRVGEMFDFFTHFFISSELGVQKPNACFFERAFERLRRSGMPELRPEETLMLGDSLTSDMAGGKAFGMKTCLYDKTGQIDVASKGIDFSILKLEQIRHIL